MDMEYTHGQMEENTKVNGRITVWMEKEYTPGKTDENIRANIWMIKNMGMANINGLMGKFTKVNGDKENSTEKAN